MSPQFLFISKLRKLIGRDGKRKFEFKMKRQAQRERKRKKPTKLKERERERMEKAMALIISRGLTRREFKQSSCYWFFVPGLSIAAYTPDVVESKRSNHVRPPRHLIHY